MALDYYLEIKQCGTTEQQLRLRTMMLDDFSLIDHKDTAIMTGTGLGVSVFIDDDNDDSELTSDLLINLRVDKGKQKEGYILLRDIVGKIFNTIDADLRLTEEGENVLMERESGRVFKRFQKHDFWLSGNKQ